MAEQNRILEKLLTPQTIVMVLAGFSSLVIFWQQMNSFKTEWKADKEKQEIRQRYTDRKEEKLQNELEDIQRWIKYHEGYEKGLQQSNKNRTNQIE